MKRKTGESGRVKEKPVDFLALRDFFSAYLHQDFHEEYGSAMEAARAFCDDASTQELNAVLTEWDVWRKQLPESVSSDVAAAAIRKLGGAWRPLDPAELDKLRSALGTMQPGQR